MTVLTAAQLIAALLLLLLLNPRACAHFWPKFMACRRLLGSNRGATSDALASRAEESLHVADVCYVLSSRCRLLSGFCLAVKNLLMRGLLGLQIATVVSESGLAWLRHVRL